MKAIEHLVNLVGDVIFDSDARTECARSFRSIENNCGQVPFLRAFVQRRANLTHHRDVQDVQRRAGKRNPRYAILNLESDVLKFHAVRNGLRQPAVSQLILSSLS
jgi:hypothetical protein